MRERQNGPEGEPTWAERAPRGRVCVLLVAMDDSPSLRKRRAQAAGLLDELPTELGVEPATKKVVRWGSAAKDRKLCSVDNCPRLQHRWQAGIVKKHGGGLRCQFSGGTKSAQGKAEFCLSMGGGRAASSLAAQRCTRKTSFAQSMEEGTLQFTGCTKAARGKTNFCKKHGGGQLSVRRCTRCRGKTEFLLPTAEASGANLGHLGEETRLLQIQAPAAAGASFEGTLTCLKRWTQPTSQ